VIVTVTPNPSVDRTLSIPALNRGAVVRGTRASAEAGGKGINVARSLTTMGIPAVALAPASPAGGALLRGLLADAADLRTVPIVGEPRVNVSLVEPDGTVTKVNEPGPTFASADSEELLHALAAAIAALDAAEPVRWVAICGSVPPGIPDDFHARLAARMPTSIRVAIDADRGALAAAVGGRAALLKPNHAELEELVGRAFPVLGAVEEAARDLLGGSLEQVLVSLGPDGALVVSQDGACHVAAPIDDLVNTVGAGDALLAGYLAGGANPTALAEAVAWSVAACRAVGTRMPPVSARDRAAVVIHGVPDPNRRLHG
jgi:1-phosphofructokinase